MPQLLDHLAEMTGYRDRDQLDVSVVRAIEEVLRPVTVGLYRSVGTEGDKRWLTRASMNSAEGVLAADHPWVDLGSLPALASQPERLRCFASAQELQVGEAPQTIYVPISTEREVIGVLELQTAQPLSASDRAVVKTVARIYGNFHDLLDNSERDPLTGLLNRQTFSSALISRHQQVPCIEGVTHERRANGERCEMWLGVVDVDHFKRINDVYGHPIGDEVLLLLSRLLRSNFRHFDRIYRYGGEEFVVVLECVRAAEAALAFERLRANVARFSFPQVGSLTVSVGFTQTTGIDTPSTAFARADNALYYVKDHGRNQVAQFEVLAQSGKVAATEVVGGIELF